MKKNIYLININIMPPIGGSSSAVSQCKITSGTYNYLYNTLNVNIQNAQTEETIDSNIINCP